jgi:hypothetical protein
MHALVSLAGAAGETSGAITGSTACRPAAFLALVGATALALLLAFARTEPLEVAHCRLHISARGNALRYRRPIWAFPPQTWATCDRKRPFFSAAGQLNPSAPIERNTQ